MDNASKALLIAGSILIVIVLISIGMIYINKSENTKETAKFGISALKLQSHNKKFEKYQNIDANRDKVKECISEIISNNSKSNSYGVKAIIEDVNLAEARKESGKLIFVGLNKAIDKVASLSISEKMKSQIRRIG